jgi:hypothetical protein
MALGVLNYESAHGTLPAGAVWANPTPPDVDSAVKKGNWSWSALILPYVEQGAVYAQISAATMDLARSMDVTGNLAKMQTPLSAYRCPTDTGPPTNEERPIMSATDVEAPLATSSYVGANGSGELRRFKGDVLDRRANGLFVVNQGAADKGIALREITDGTSNTVLVGERAWETTLSGENGFVFGRGGVVFGIRGIRENSEIGLADSLGCGKYRLNFASKTADNKQDSYARRGFSSQHPGGAQFANADGSVRFIADEIEGNFNNEQIAATEEVDSPYEALMGKDDDVPIGSNL